MEHWNWVFPYEFGVGKGFLQLTQEKAEIQLCQKKKIWLHRTIDSDLLPIW